MRPFHPLLRPAASTVFPFRFRLTRWIIRLTVETRETRKGILHQLRLEAEEKTKDEMGTLRTQLMQQGATAQQAQTQAWEMVREKYILLPPED